ncbi:MAG: hypothetical protein JW772_04535 [Candidatus Diapherotrites archaeon]|nr:hypothetical protein [Candidatus Diapherotrites archaeon]
MNYTPKIGKFFVIFLILIFAASAGAETFPFGSTGDQCEYVTNKAFNTTEVPNNVIITNIKSNELGHIILGTESSQIAQNKILYSSTVGDASLWNSNNSENATAQTTDIVMQQPYGIAIVNVYNNNTVKDQMYMSYNSGVNWQLADSRNREGNGNPKYAFLYSSSGSSSLYVIYEFDNILKKVGGSPGSIAHSNIATVNNLDTIRQIQGHSNGTVFIAGKNTSNKPAIFYATGYNLTNWTQASGLPNETGVTAKSVLQVNNSTYLAIVTTNAGDYVYRSTDSGQTWNQYFILPGGQILKELVKTESGVFLSTENGEIFRIKDPTKPLAEAGFGKVNIGETTGYNIAYGGKHSIYVSNNLGGNNTIHRISCNTRPNPEITVTGEEALNETIKLSAAGSSDPDGDEFIYTWSKSDEAGEDIAQGQENMEEIEYTITERGHYFFQIAALDNGKPALEGAASYSFMVGGSPPEIATSENVTCAVNEPCTLTTVVTDADGDEVTIIWIDNDFPEWEWWTTDEGETGEFTPTELGTYSITVYATDEFDESQKEVTVTVQEEIPEEEPPATPPPATNEAVCGNQTCESDLGENETTCPEDCSAEPPADNTPPGDDNGTPPPETPPGPEDQNPAEQNDNTGETGSDDTEDQTPPEDNQTNKGGNENQQTIGDNETPRGNEGNNLVTGRISPEIAVGAGAVILIAIGAGYYFLRVRKK